MIETREKFGKWLSDSYPYISIWIGPILLIGWLLINGKVIFWGTTYLQFLPWRSMGWEQMTSGHFPLWNNLNGYGTPLLANYQSAFFYPPNILIWVFALFADIKGIAIAQTLLVMGHLIAAGYGVIFLTKELGISKLGQVVAAIAFSLSGYLVSRASFLSMNSALAWLPWILFTNLRIATYSTWKQAFHQKEIILAILFHTLLLFSGHAQIAWYTMLLTFFWLITWSWYHHRFSKILFSLGIYIIVIGFSIGLSSVQIIPTGEFLLQSQRANQVEFSYALNYSFWPWRFLTILSPNLFGNPARGNYWVTADNYWEDNVYTGLLTIIFAITSMIRLIIGRYENEKKLRVVITFSLITIAVSLIFSLGKYTPIFPFLYRYIPTFDMFQAPTRFSIWFVAMIPVLGGLSVDHWIKPSGRWLYWSRLLAAGAMGITGTSILIWLLLKNRFQETYIIGIAETGAFLSILLLINLFAPRQIKKPSQASNLMILCILGLLIGDLTYNNLGVNPGILSDNLDKFNLKNDKTRYSEEQTLVFISPQVEEEITFTRFFQFASFQPIDGWNEINDYFIPNTNIFNQVNSVNNFDPLVTARFDQWSKIFFPEISPSSTDINQFFGISTVITDSLSSKGVITPEKDTQSRFRWFSCATPAKNVNDAVLIMAQQVKNGTLREKIVVEGIIKNGFECNQQNNDMDANVVHANPVYTKVQVFSKNAGWLMQLAANYPGWIAKVDGQATSVYYGDILFRTIYLEAGEHSVEFFYKPLSFTVGLIISVFFLFVSIIYLSIRRKFKE